MSERVTQAGFRGEMGRALEAIYYRVEALEQKLGELDRELGKSAPEGEAPTKDQLLSYRVLLFDVRRAIYGYTQLLNLIGLPKDHKQAIQAIHDMINAVIRLQQTIYMLEMAMAAGMGPAGIFYLLVAGGTFASTFTYSARASGGGT
mgnify:CR=1 FL=1